MKEEKIKIVLMNMNSEDIDLIVRKVYNKPYYKVVAKLKRTAIKPKTK